MTDPAVTAEQPHSTGQPGTTAQPVAEPDHRAIAVRAVIGVLVGVIGVVAVVALSRHASRVAATAGSSPLAIAAADAPQATSASCTSLLSALPAQVIGQDRRQLLDPEPGVAAWGDPATVLRCGLGTPTELDCSAALQVIAGVSWLQLDGGDGSSTFLAVDRPVRVAVTLPVGAGVGALQQLGAVVAQRLTARAVCTDGTLVPVTG